MAEEVPSRASILFPYLTNAEYLSLVDLLG
jgi:hypothetical protein